MVRSRANNITMAMAHFFYNPDAKSPPPPKINKRYYHDDGVSITMQLRELVGGVEEYKKILGTGNNKYFILQIDGEDFAAMYPFNKAATDLPFVNVDASAPLKKAKIIFEEACAQGNLILTHKHRPFGELIPYVIPKPE